MKKNKKGKNKGFFKKISSMFSKKVKKNKKAGE